MIVNVRGTSGSGKSTIVKEVLGQLTDRINFSSGPGWKHISEDLVKRRQPVGYYGKLGRAGVAVPGHYETACGGCDTLPGYDTIFGLVREAREANGVTNHVLFEGLLVSEESRRTLELHRDFPGELKVVFLNTPVEVCLESIRQRRLARGDERPLKEDNTRNRVKTIERVCSYLREQGVDVFETVDRAEAAERVRGYLR